LDSLNALQPSVPGVAFISLIAFHSLDSLSAWYTLRTSVSGITFYALNTLVACIARVSLHSLDALIALVTLVSRETLRARDTIADIKDVKERINNFETSFRTVRSCRFRFYGRRNSVCAGITSSSGVTLCASVTFQTLRTDFARYSLNALDSLIALNTLVTSIALITLNTLYALLTLITFRTGVTRITLRALRALRTDWPLITGITFYSRLALRSGFTRCAGVALFTLRADVTLRTL
jgi:hypothetical protein